MIIVKLGGSVITDKSKYKTFKEESTSRLAKEIVASGEQVIIVHGAGSFGHVLADQFKLQNGLKDKKQIEGVSRVMLDVRELNFLVMKALNEQGLFSMSIPPSAAASLNAGDLVNLDIAKFRDALKLGLTPVTFGDVVLDTKRGVGICSGDKLIEYLAAEFHPDRIIFCTDVDGVYDCDPSIDPDANRLDFIDETTLNSLPRTQKVADVTGSIFGKLESMLRISEHSKECMVINGNVPGRLKEALRGKQVIGTVVKKG